MRILILIFFTFQFVPIHAQDARLAEQYLLNSEFEKAATLYEKLVKENDGNDYYFDKYIESLSALSQFDKCKSILEKQLKKRPKECSIYVTLGNILEKQSKPDEAKIQFQKAIAELGADQYNVMRLAQSFANLTKYDYALQAYERGATLLKDKKIFAYNIGDLYRAKGDMPKMTESFLNTLAPNDFNKLETAKMLLQQSLTTPEQYSELQTQLYARLQSEPDATHYIELLTWTFIQQKDYKNALRQSKALDKKLNENGSRIFQLANIAAVSKDYEAAIAAYEYVAVEKGRSSPFYAEARRGALHSRRDKITDGYNYAVTELQYLESNYDTVLTELGRNRNTASLIMEQADLEAFYLNDLEKATSHLKELVNMSGLDRNILGQAKVSLADIYLIQGERWESTLLYSQVDKEFKDDILGHEARFRNAKLAYYNGDFEWAQSQFSVLKASTSKLIANDALDLSVFILENTGMDSTTTAMQLYAEADLLIFQNKFEEAFVKLDSILVKFPEHSLDDDVLWSKSQIYLKKRNYTKAAELLQTIVEKYKEEIRADNALFTLAGLYAKPLNDPEKAKNLYEKLFTEFSGSTLAVDARKEFRKLRGDKVQ